MSKSTISITNPILQAVFGTELEPGSLCRLEALFNGYKTTLALALLLDIHYNNPDLKLLFLSQDSVKVSIENIHNQGSYTGGVTVKRVMPYLTVAELYNVVSNNNSCNYDVIIIDDFPIITKRSSMKEIADVNEFISYCRKNDMALAITQSVISRSGLAIKQEDNRHEELPSSFWHGSVSRVNVLVTDKVIHVDRGMTKASTITSSMPFNTTTLPFLSTLSTFGSEN